MDNRLLNDRNRKMVSGKQRFLLRFLKEEYFTHRNLIRMQIHFCKVFYSGIYADGKNFAHGITTNSITLPCKKLSGKGLS
jgi:hypothetical protein